MGENTAVILDPKSAPTTATKPIGTGPFKFDTWAKGSSITLVKNDGYRDAGAIKMKKVTFRFINDPAAQVAALLAGDVDGLPRFGALESLKQFQDDPRFTVAVGGTEGKTIMAINNKKKPFDDVRVRRALAAAIDRKAVIDGAQEGYGTPIGSHMVPSDAGYVDLTGVNPYNPEKAKALLKEAGVATPLNVTLTLPPPPYARKGGEIIAAQLAKVGVIAKIENVEWAQWLSGAVQGQLRPDRHQPRRAARLRPLRRPELLLRLRLARRSATCSTSYNTTHRRRRARLKLLGDIQRQLAEDCVNALPVPAAAVRRRQQAAEGPVEQLADLRQRPRARAGMAPDAARGARATAMTALHELGAAELRRTLPASASSRRSRRRARCSTASTRWEPHLHATYALDPDAALAAGARSRGALAARRARRVGALDGVPVDDQGEHRHRAATPMPLGTAATELVAGAARRAAGGAPARSRRGDPRQDHDARLRHAVVGPVELPRLTRNPWDLSKNPGG